MESQPEARKTSEETGIVQKRLNGKLACRDEAQRAQRWYGGERTGRHA
jgi:hypothetical protein